jgi:hypothetical protein
MNLKVSRFQKQSDQGSAQFFVTYTVTVHPKEKELSTKYPLPEGFIFAATNHLGNELPVGIEWTEQYETPDDAVYAINARKDACEEIIRYLQMAHQFADEQNYTFPI